MMRPADNTRVWRKQQRAEQKGVPAGRRTTHKVRTQQPDDRSTWEQAWRRRRAGLPMWPLDTPDGA